MDSYSFRRAPSSFPGTWLLPCLVLLTSCGLPKPFDLRAEMSNAIQNLGISAFYPLRESPRIGSIYLVDRSTAEPGVHLSPTDETSTVLHDKTFSPFLGLTAPFSAVAGYKLSDLFRYAHSRTA